jgi:hypothetical protein
MPNPEIASHSAEGARRSAQVRRRLVYEDVLAALGELETPTDAKRWLKTAFVWGASGLIPGTMANACASCVREWLKAHEAELNHERVKALEERIRELEARPKLEPRHRLASDPPYASGRDR